MYQHGFVYERPPFTTPQCVGDLGSHQHLDWRHGNPTHRARPFVGPIRYGDPMDGFYFWSEERRCENHGAWSLASCLEMFPNSQVLKIKKSLKRWTVSVDVLASIRPGKTVAFSPYLTG